MADKPVMEEDDRQLELKLLCDKYYWLWYYENDISENDFCGNESIFIFYLQICFLMELYVCQIDN